MKVNSIHFKETLLNQIRDYLDGKITKEEYYEQAESFYTKCADTYENTSFHEYFMDTIPDACLIYIDEPGLPPEKKELMFYKILKEAYANLQKL